MERRKSLRRSSRTSLGVTEISKTFDYRDDADADDEEGPDPPSLVRRAIRNLPIERYTSNNLTLSSQDSLDTFNVTSLNDNVPLKELAIQVVKYLPIEKVKTDEESSDASTIPISPERRHWDKTLKPSEEEFLRNFEFKQLRSVTRTSDRSPEKRQLRSSDKERYIPTKSPRLSTGDKYKKSTLSKTPPTTSKKTSQSNASTVIKSFPQTTVKSKDSNSLPKSSAKVDKSPGLRRSNRISSTSKDNLDSDSTENHFLLKSQQKSKNSSSSFVRPSPSKAFESKDKKKQDSDSFKSTQLSVVSKKWDEANGKTLPFKKPLSARSLERNESQDSDSSDFYIAHGSSLKSTKSVISKSPTRRSPRKIVKSKDIHLDTSKNQSTLKKLTEKSPQQSVVSKNRDEDSSAKTLPFKKPLSARSLELNESQNSDSSDFYVSLGSSLKSTKSVISKSPTRRSPRKIVKSKDIHSNASEKQSTLKNSTEKSTQRSVVSKNKDEANWKHSSSTKTLPFKKTLSTKSLERNESRDSDSSDSNLSYGRLLKSTKSTRRSPRKFDNMFDKQSTLQKTTEKSPQKDAVHLTPKKASLTKRVKADANLSSPDIRNLSKAAKTLKLQPENDKSDSDFNLSKDSASHFLNIEDTRKKRKQLEISSLSPSSRSSTKKVIGLPNTLFRYYPVKKTTKGLNRNFSVKDISSHLTVNDDNDHDIETSERNKIIQPLRNKALNKITPETSPTPSEVPTERLSWSVARNVQREVKENSPKRLNGSGTITTIVIKGNKETMNDSLSTFSIENFIKRKSQPNSPSPSQKDNEINLIEIPSPNKATTPSKSKTPNENTPLKSPGKQMPQKYQSKNISNSLGILSPFKIPSPNWERRDVNLAIQDFLQRTKSPSSTIEKSSQRLNKPSEGVQIATKDVVVENEEDEIQPDLNTIVRSPKPRNVRTKNSTLKERVGSDSLSESSDDLALSARRITVVKKKRNLKSNDKKAGGKNREQMDSLVLRKWAVKVFKEKTGMRHSKEVLDMIGPSVEKFIQQVMDDVSAYADHAGRNTIIKEDFILYFKRIGVLNQAMGFSDLVLEYLPSHYRKLVPCAGAFNKILK